jgi:hypothetical protein
MDEDTLDDNLILIGGNSMTLSGEVLKLFDTSLTSLFYLLILLTYLFISLI